MDEIAVIGVGCRFPGADNLDEFWRVLVNGENHVVDIPSDRWNLEAFYDADGDAPHKTYVRKAGFVRGHDEWDSRLFQISDLEASRMDPQQKFALECTFMALENAGIPRSKIAGTNAGVYIGVMNTDYKDLYTTESEMNNYTLTGTSGGNVAARISYVFDLRGNSLTVNTACSSSLVAVHMACQALRAGECDVAICGGVNCLLEPGVFIQLSKARMASPSGRCQAFSADADGYARGEGCGIIILKKMEDARHDDDHVWGSIFTGVNQDGHTVTPMTAPSWKQQKVLFTDVFRRSGIDLNSVEYVEAHGTGTRAGDPVEIRSLGEFFLESNSSKRRLIGSVKTNIGHLESAAGIAGVIKVLLMMKYNKIVPSLHFNTPNPRIDFNRYNLEVATGVTDWLTPRKFACVNSFSFGGTNSHAVLASPEMLQSEMSAHVNEGDRPHIICFSGNTKETVLKSIEQFCSQIEHRKYNLRDLEYTSCLRRDVYPTRVAILADTTEEAIRQAEAAVNERGESIKVRHEKPRIIFVFCGMGTGWQGMCREMLDSYPKFSQTIDAIDACLTFYVPWSLRERLEQSFDAMDPLFGPIAIFSCQVALADLWRHWGVEPKCIVGQSVGEVAAAYAAGILTLEKAVRVIYHRSSVLAETTGGKMLVVGNYPVQKIEALCNQYPGKVNVSLYYNPTSCSISGDAEVVDEIKARIEVLPTEKDDAIIVRDLNVTKAYHSHHMEDCKVNLSRKLSNLSGSQPVTDIISSVTGTHVLNGEFRSGKYWAKSIRDPCFFYQALLKTFHKKQKNICLEIGPKAVLRAHMKYMATEENVISLPSMLEHSESRCILQTLCRLFELGMQPSWENVLSTEGVQVVDVPRNAFQRSKNMILPEDSRQKLIGAPMYVGCHRLVRQVRGSKAPSFKAFLEPEVLQSVYEHLFQGTVVFPGALYVELILASGSLQDVLFPYNSKVSLEIKEALRLYHGKTVELDIRLREKQTPDGKTKCDVIISQGDKVYAKGSYQKLTSTPVIHIFDIHSIQKRCDKTMLAQDKYKLLEKMGFSFGREWKVSGQSWYNSNESLMKLDVKEKLKDEMQGIFLHPAILDGVFQAAVPLMHGAESRPFLPVKVGLCSLKRPVHEAVYVYAYPSYKTEALHLYDLFMLNATGQIVLEIRDFGLQFLGVETVDRVAFSPVWRHFDKKIIDVTKKQRDSFWSSTLLMSNMPLWNQLAITTNWWGLNEDALKKELEEKITEEIFNIVVINNFESKEMSCSVHEEMQNLCWMLRCLTLILSQRSTKIPILVFTLGTWQTDQIDTNICTDVIPVGAGLWGLVRNILREKVYDDIKLVDLHLSQVDDISHLLPSVSLTVLSNAFRDKPEILMTKDNIYISEVVRTDVIDTQRYRPQFCDDSCRASLYSKSGSHDVENLFLRYEKDDLPKQRKDIVEVKTTAVSILNSSRTGQSDRVSSETGFSLWATEVTGRQVGSFSEHEDIEVVTCCPVKASTFVHVPESCLLLKKDFPNYKPGFLTRLLVLYQLSKNITSGSVGILSNEESISYAQLLVTMLHTKGINEVQILSVNDLKDGDQPYETLLSLVHLSTHAAKNLSKVLKSGQRYSSIETLVNTRAIAALCHYISDLCLDMLTMTNILSPTTIMRDFPAIRQWIKENASAVLTATKLWIQEDENKERFESPYEIPSDISRLMQMTTIALDSSTLHSLRVKAEEVELFRKDAVYIVVGGLTGLGWECVEFLAKHRAGHIAIINRRTPSVEKKQQLKILVETYGCRTLCLQADVCQIQSLQDALFKIDIHFSPAPIKGVFFGAAVLQDALLETMTIEQFHSVSAPKVAGAWNMHIVTKQLPLDYFVLHSSMTSLFGNVGQSSYSAANAFLDALAHHRRNLDLSGQSINWGPLSLGMMKGNKAAVKQMDKQGIKVLEKEEIHKCLTLALKKNAAQMLLCKFELDKFSCHVVEENNPSLLRRVMPILNKAMLHKEAGKLSNTKVHIDVRSTVKLQKAERQDTLQKYVISVTSRVFCLDDSIIDSDTSVFDLGIDSMLAMALVTQIFQDTECRLPVSLLLGPDCTIMNITRTLDDLLMRACDQRENQQDQKQTAREKWTENPVSLSYYEQRDFHENVCVFFDLKWKSPPGKVTVVLKDAALMSLSRHALLHTTYVTENQKDDGASVIRKVLTPEEALDIREVETAEEMQVISLEKLSHKKGPVRFIVCRKPEFVVRFILSCVVFDFASSIMFVEDFTRIIIRKLRNIAIPEAKYDTKVSIGAEIEKALSERGQNMKKYWKQVVSQDIPVVSLSNKECRIVQPGRRLEVQLNLPLSTYDDVMIFCSSHKVTLFEVFFSCYQLLLSLVSGEGTVPLFMSTSARVTIPKLQNAFGNTTNDVPAVARIELEETISDFVKKNSTIVETSLENSLYPTIFLQEMAENAENFSNMNRHGVILEDTNAIKVSKAIAEAAGFPIEISPVRHLAISHETSLFIWQDSKSKKLELVLGYHGDLISTSRAKHILDVLLCLLEDVVHVPQAPLSTLTSKPYIQSLKRMDRT